MSEFTHKQIEANGLTMHVVEAGNGFPVLLCHGFPEIWYSWRHQLRALADAGFRAIAPDQRGYGGTDAPQAIEAYTVHHLVGDLTGLLDALGIDKAAVVGHDFGGIVMWQMALLAPHRVAAVVAVNTPFMPRPPAPPTQILRAMARDKFQYMLYFQEPGVAEAELDRDVARSLRNFYRAVPKEVLDSYKDQVPGVFGEAGGGLLGRLPDARREILSLEVTLRSLCAPSSTAVSAAD